MTAASHLASIRELRDIRRERPRMSGETEDQYYHRLAQELDRRQRAQRRRSHVVQRGVSRLRLRPSPIGRDRLTGLATSLRRLVP
jgi:hypothetical protein